MAGPRLADIEHDIVNPSLGGRFVLVLNGIAVYPISPDPSMRADDIFRRAHGGDTQALPRLRRRGMSERLRTVDNTINVTTTIGAQRSASTSVCSFDTVS
jgi:hypothetical protein